MKQQRPGPRKQPQEATRTSTRFFAADRADNTALHPSGSIQTDTGDTTTATSSEPLILGRSRAIQTVIEQVHLVAPTDTTVLIVGETGAGKEYVARAIHQLSQRRSGPLISINCGGIPATLLEDELFGHERGAFTDARTQRKGRFEQAHKGTLFLDEVAELPLELQPKLLRAIQEKEIYRIGGSNPIRVDVRFIAATNANLWERVQQGRFREDLFFRLHVFPIYVPPLRERREDIPILADYFLERLSRKYQMPRKFLSPAAEAELMRRDWPGNIRELENVLEVAWIRSRERQEITLKDLPPADYSETMKGLAFLDAASGPADPDLKTMLMRYEFELITRALARAQGSRRKAARLLGIKRTTLIEKLKRFRKLGWLQEEVDDSVASRRERTPRET